MSKRPPSTADVAGQIIRARRQLVDLLGREEAAALIEGQKRGLKAWMTTRLHDNPLLAALSIIAQAEGDRRPLRPATKQALVVAAGELCPLITKPAATGRHPSSGPNTRPAGAAPAQEIEP